mmetsp:Transcript_29827/g.98934  ORF Transcript_29827/g.98934 Transcript_29827/m.98934 type:complete len:260 (-) Transcript_29827:14-793(-)
MPLNRLQNSNSVEPLHEDEGRAQGRPHEVPGQGEGVVHGRGDQVDGVWHHPQGTPLLQRRNALLRQLLRARALPQRALWLASGAARVCDRAALPRMLGRPGTNRRLGQQATQRQAAVEDPVHGNEGLHLGKPGPHRGDGRREFGAEEEHVGVGVVDDVGDLVADEVPVDRRKAEAQHLDHLVRQHPLHAIFAVDRGSDSAVGQLLGQSVREAVPLGGHVSPGQSVGTVGHDGEQPLGRWRGQPHGSRAGVAMEEEQQEK